MKKFNLKSTLLEVHKIYLSEVATKEMEYYHSLIASAGYDCWGFCTASEKYAVRVLLEEHTKINYSKELGALLRMIVSGKLYERNSQELEAKIDNMPLGTAIHNLKSKGFVVVD